MPASIVTQALSSAIPQQPGPTSFQRSAATNSSLPSGMGFAAFSQGSSAGLPMLLNRMLVDLANIGGAGGCGCGVLSGLSPSSASGLTVTISEGVGIGPGGLAYYAGGTTTATDSATVYLWLSQSGTILTSPTTAVPTNGAVYLGAAIASGGNVTQVDMSGVVYLSGGVPTRETGDRGYAVDTPAFPLRAKTQAGVFEWDGDAWRAIGTPANVQSITGTLTLDEDSAPRQVIDPGASTRKVLVPSSRIRDGVLEIHHSGAAGAIDIRDSGDTTTLLSLSVGDRAVLYPSFASGPAYPSATAI